MTAPLSNDINEDQIPLAAEDKFIIIAIRDAPELCPTFEIAQIFASALNKTEFAFGKVIPIFDFRGLTTFYDDVINFIRAFEQRPTHLLVNKSDLEALDEMNLGHRDLQIIITKGEPQRTTPLRLSEFYPMTEEVRLGSGESEPMEFLALNLVSGAKMRESTEYLGDATRQERYADLEVPISEFAWKAVQPDLPEIFSWTAEEFPSLSTLEFAKSFQDTIPVILRDKKRGHEMIHYAFLKDYLRAAYLLAFLRGIHRHSVLAEFAIATQGNELICVPYHSHAIHEVEMPKAKNLLVGRPAVVAKTTQTVLSEEIQLLTSLLNNPKTREREIQLFLEKHPNFLRGLNYKNIYPQLVLQREDAGSLIPDFILEPFDGAWCDILDVKLPRQKLIVGPNDRETLAAGIHAVAAQLREYAAYFEQEKYRKFVNQKFGLRIYRPRLIALVGRDMVQMDSPELRRAMTAYNDLRVMTFDELIKHSKSRLLV